MNVMLFSKICARSGVGNHMRQLAESLVDKGHSVWVVSSTNQQKVEDRDRLQFVLLPVTSMNPIQILRNLFKLHNLIKSNQIDVVHCHHRLAALYMRVYRFFWRIPMVYTLHLAPVPYDYLHRKLTYVGDQAIAVSTEVKEFMVDKLKIPGDKIAVVLNGVYLPDMRREGYNRNEVLNKYHILEGKYVLLMNSRIDEVKNHLLMVEAVQSLQEEIRDRVVVVCTGEKSGKYYETVLQHIEHYGLQEVFIFTGWADSYEILTVADFLFVPSKSEGFSLSCAEAFLMKVPVARTKTGGYEDMKDICIPISSEDYHSIDEIIKSLVHNGKECYKRLTEKAYKYAYENFTIQSMVDNTLDVYRKTIAGQKQKHLGKA